MDPVGGIHESEAVVSVTPVTVTAVGGGFVVVVALTGPAGADSTPSVFGVSGYTGGGKELIEVHEKTPNVEPFGLYGVELTHKHVPEMTKYSGLARAPVFAPSVGRYAQGMLVEIPLQLWAIPGAPTPKQLLPS